MLGWGNWDVRVYATQAWVSLAPRFAGEHPVILERLEAALDDPVAAVRLQVARNLQVVSATNPERMWELALRIAVNEADAEVIATYLFQSMRRFGHHAPERCEAVLRVVKSRLGGDFGASGDGADALKEAFGDWIGILFVGQGRPLARGWLVECASESRRYQRALGRFLGNLRAHLFDRYAADATTGGRAICDRAQESLSLILTHASTTASDAYAVLVSDADEEAKDSARELYRAAAMTVDHATKQLYFGSGAYAAGKGRGTAEDSDRRGLLNAQAMARFLEDYAEILAKLGTSREPATLHHLIELYEFLVPGNPAAVFEAIHAILLGAGQDEGYHREALGNSAVVRIVQLYIADYRDIFDDEGRRARLVAILRLFSEVGWSDSIRLLYELPELLR